MAENKKQIKDFNLLTNTISSQDNLLVQRDNGTTFRIHINSLPFTDKDYTSAGLATSSYVNSQNTILNNKIVALQSSSGRIESSLNNYLLKSNYRLHSTAGYATITYVNNAISGISGGSDKDYTTAGLASIELLNSKVAQIYSSQGNYLLKDNYKLHSTAGYATSTYVNNQDTIINNKVIELQSSSGRVEKALTALSIANTGDETQSTILTKGVKSFTDVTWIISTPITIDAYANDKAINTVTGNQLIQYSNLVNGSQLSFVIDKQTASDVTITLPNNTLAASGTGEAIVSLIDTTVLLSGASGGKYYFSVRNINGILYTQIVKLAAENTLGFVKNFYCNNVQAPWTLGGSTLNSDQIIVSVTIPVGAMGLNSVMEINTIMSRPGDTNTSSFKVKEGSNLLSNILYNSATILSASNTFLIANRNSLTSQIVSKTNTTNSATQLFTMDFTTQRVLTFCININNLTQNAAAFESISIRIQN